MSEHSHLSGMYHDLEKIRRERQLSRIEEVWSHDIEDLLLQVLQDGQEHFPSAMNYPQETVIFHWSLVERHAGTRTFILDGNELTLKESRQACLLAAINYLHEKAHKLEQRAEELRNLLDVKEQ